MTRDRKLWINWNTGEWGPSDEVETFAVSDDEYQDLNRLAAGNDEGDIRDFVPNLIGHRDTDGTWLEPMTEKEWSTWYYNEVAEEEETDAP